MKVRELLMKVGELLMKVGELLMKVGELRVKDLTKGMIYREATFFDCELNKFK